MLTSIPTRHCQWASLLDIANGHLMGIPNRHWQLALPAPALAGGGEEEAGGGGRGGRKRPGEGGREGSGNPSGQQAPSGGGCLPGAMGANLLGVSLCMACVCRSPPQAAKAGVSVVPTPATHLYLSSA